jgi:hypothetical protein
VARLRPFDSACPDERLWLSQTLSYYDLPASARRQLKHLDGDLLEEEQQKRRRRPSPETCKGLSGNGMEVELPHDDIVGPQLIEHSMQLGSVPGAAAGGLLEQALAPCVVKARFCAAWTARAGACQVLPALVGPVSRILRWCSAQRPVNRSVT